LVSLKEGKKKEAFKEAYDKKKKEAPHTCGGIVEHSSW
jgi:hypothetical protein